MAARHDERSAVKDNGVGDACGCLVVHVYHAPTRESCLPPPVVPRSCVRHGTPTAARRQLAESFRSTCAARPCGVAPQLRRTGKRRLDTTRLTSSNRRRPVRFPEDPRKSRPTRAGASRSSPSKRKIYIPNKTFATESQSTVAQGPANARFS